MSKEEILEKLKQAVVNMDPDGAKTAAQEADKAGVEPFEAISKGLSMGVKEIGELWNKMEIFYPEVMAAVDAYYAGLNVLKPKITPKESEKYFATAVFGTIYGDIHSVGKDVVIPVFQGEDFNVIDLGVDVSAEKYVQAIKENGAQMVGLGTYMSETFLHVDQVIKEFEKAGIRDQVLVVCGGPAVDSEVAKRMGADEAYRNAWEAVQDVKRLLKERQLVKA